MPPTPRSTPRRLTSFALKTEGEVFATSRWVALSKSGAALGGISGEVSGVASRTSIHRASAAAAPAASEGSGARKASTGRRSAATAPTSPPTTMTCTPKRGRVREVTPAHAAIAMTLAITTPTTTDFAAVPKVEVAHSLTGVGGMSMAVEATTSMGA